MEYKENTVGWWLSQLKEPLRSRAIEVGANSLNEHCLLLEDAIGHVHEMGDYPDEDNDFWHGVDSMFCGVSSIVYLKTCSEKCREGYNMAKECAPDPEQVAETPPLPIPPRFKTESEHLQEALGRIAKLEAAQRADRAEIMRLEAEIAELSKRMDEFIKENTYEYPA